MRRVMGLLGVLALVTGCADLGAVNQWATSAVDATRFNQIVATYADTPTRLARYEPTNRAAFEAQAEERAAQGKALEQALTGIRAYMAALAALSSGQPVKVDEDIGKIGQSLAKLGPSGAKLSGPIANIVGLLGGEAVGIWRSREVATLVERANPSIQEALGRDSELARIVGTYFARDLASERLFLRAYYAALAREAGLSSRARAAVEELGRLRAAENARRRAAAESFTDVLTKLAEGHQALHDNRGDLSAEALAKRLLDLAKALQKDMTAILKAA